MKGNFVHAYNGCIYVHMIISCRSDIEYVFLFVFIVRSLDLYKAKSPLDIELVNG